MATEVKVPALGESVTEATIGQWLKQPGEAVQLDEPIASLETDKVAIEVNRRENMPGAKFDDVKDLVSGQRGRVVYEKGDVDYGVSIGVLEVFFMPLGLSLTSLAPLLLCRSGPPARSLA